MFAFSTRARKWMALDRAGLLFRSWNPGNNPGPNNMSPPLGGACREHGILVLRMEGPLFYANASSLRLLPEKSPGLRHSPAEVERLQEWVEEQDDVAYKYILCRSTTKQAAACPSSAALRFCCISKFGRSWIIARGVVSTTRWTASFYRQQGEHLWHVGGLGWLH